jgi:hypothetical protein
MRIQLAELQMAEISSFQTMTPSTAIFGVFVIIGLSILNLVVVFGTDYKALLAKWGKSEGTVKVKTK